MCNNNKNTYEFAIFTHPVNISWREYLRGLSNDRSPSEVFQLLLCFAVSHLNALRGRGFLLPTCQIWCAGYRGTHARGTRERMSDIPDLLKKLFYNQHGVCVCGILKEYSVHPANTHTHHTQFTYKGDFIGNEGILDGPHNFKGFVRVSGFNLKLG